uniref:Uncharacterized protein n=1 Tax=Oryza punctata TaxID=4537 RepID=A0A0E0L1W2_ORYPU
MKTKADTLLCTIRDLSLKLVVLTEHDADHNVVELALHANPGTSHHHPKTARSLSYHTTCQVAGAQRDQGKGKGQRVFWSRISHQGLGQVEKSGDGVERRAQPREKNSVLAGAGGEVAARLIEGVPFSPPLLAG